MDRVALSKCCLEMSHLCAEVPFCDNVTVVGHGALDVETKNRKLDGVDAGNHDLLTPNSLSSD